jgi:ethanolamine permease
MTVVIGGQYYRWNDSFHGGFWSTFTSILLNGTGYICLACCMSEMSSTLPFSGGIYGFVRAFMGPFSGYVVSRYEIILNISYVSNLTLLLGSMPTYGGLSSKELEPVWWIFMYSFCVSMAIWGCNKRSYWMFIKAIGGISLLLIVIYILGSFAFVDFDRYADGGESINGMEFFEKVHHTAGMFRGIQYLPLVSIKIENPKRDIPRGMFYGMITLFITAIGVVFTTSSQAPGALALAHEKLPLTYGFCRIFNLSYDQAMWLTLPAMFANFYGFVWAYGRQFSAMAKSGLLPEMFGYMTTMTDTPYVSLIAGTIVSFIVALLAFYDALYVSFKDDLKHLYMLSSYIVYMLLFACYIIFKEKYSSLARNFSSPFGIYGAIVGFGIFALDGIGVLIFECRDNQIPLIILVVSAIGMSIYFYLILQGNQQFSEEEKQDLFKAYLINANVKSRAAVKKRQQLKASVQFSANAPPGSGSNNNSISSQNKHQHGDFSLRNDNLRANATVVANNQVLPDEQQMEMDSKDVEKGEETILSAEPVTVHEHSSPVKRNAVLPI